LKQCAWGAAGSRNPLLNLVSIVLNFYLLFLAALVGISAEWQAKFRVGSKTPGGSSRFADALTVCFDPSDIQDLTRRQRWLW